MLGGFTTETKDEKLEIQLVDQPITALDILQEDQKEVINNIIKADDKAELQRQFDLFNLNQSKKNAARVIKLEELRENIENQIIERFNKRPDQISNKELLEYLDVITTQIDKSQKVVDSVEQKDTIKALTKAATTQTTNEVNINLGTELTRDNKENVVTAIKDIIGLLQSNNITEMTEVSEPETLIVVPEEDEN